MVKLLFALLFLAVPLTVLGGEKAYSGIAGLSKEEALRLGEAMYHRGDPSIREKVEGYRSGRHRGRRDNVHLHGLPSEERDRII